jgi:hypothetical protein
VKSLLSVAAMAVLYLVAPSDSKCEEVVRRREDKRLVSWSYTMRQSLNEC